MRVISEGPTKITKSTIEAAWRRRTPKNRLIVRDKDCRGLALIVNPTGMTWSYAFRARGTNSLTGRRWPNRTVTLGNPATHSPEDARVEANRFKGQVAAGVDPAAEKKQRAEAERRKQGTTLGRLADDYAVALPRRPKIRGAGNPSPAYVAEEVSQLALALAMMGVEKMPVRNLTADDVRRLLGEASGGNTRARFGALSRFLDWCQDTGHVDANVCALIARARRPKAPQARAHYLTPNALARLWRAADRLREPVWRDFARFLIAVPCRRGEAAQMEWSHVDLAAAEWRQPGHLTKNREPHRLHLNELALEVLRTRCRTIAEAQANGDLKMLARQLASGAPKFGLVFAAPVSGRVIDTFTAIKAVLSGATGPRDDEGIDSATPPLTGWTWHDFRRSFATALGEAGIPETIADAILNHRQAASRGGVLGVYQRASRWPEQKRAMDLWGKMLTEAITGTVAPANVAPIASRQG